MDDDGEGAWRDWRRPCADHLIFLLVLAMGVRLGLQVLNDNSFLTHLATGRLILDRGSVPSADPYSFTAAGEPWTVQSWGASVLYAAAEDVGGLLAVRMLNALLVVSLVLVLWRLARVGTSLVARLVVMGVVVGMGSTLWVERPLLFGALGLALVLLAAEDRLDPRWLVPVMWVWVNTHGSFPFGVGVLVLLAAGQALDERRRPTVELRALAWAAAGTLLGAVGPIGPKVLVFPLTAFSESEAFEGVKEWGRPEFDRGFEQLFAIQLLLSVVVVLARHRRWRAVLPALVFGGAALTGTRNILQASIVLTPILAVALRGLGSIETTARPRALRPLAVAMVALVVVVAAVGLTGDDTALDDYPEQATAWMADNDLLGPDARVVHRDFVGNYLEYRYGPDQVRVFYDDRVDMFPLDVNRDHRSLLRSGTDYQAVLDRHRATAVLWDLDSDLGRWLVDAEGWDVVHRDEVWAVAVPTGG